jgi:hypothetical protein
MKTTSLHDPFVSSLQKANNSVTKGQGQLQHMRVLKPWECFFFFFFFFEFFVVAPLANNPKRKEPNLAAGQRGEQNFLRILLYFGDLQ